MHYRCVKCKEEFDLNPNERVRCPFCGYRVLVKTRPEFKKEVKVK